MFAQNRTIKYMNSVLFEYSMYLITYSTLEFFPFPLTYCGVIKFVLLRNKELRSQIIEDHQ